MPLPAIVITVPEGCGRWAESECETDESKPPSARPMSIKLTGRIEFVSSLLVSIGQSRPSRLDLLRSYSEGPMYRGDKQPACRYKSSTASSEKSRQHSRD